MTPCSGVGSGGRGRKALLHRPSLGFRYLLRPPSLVSRFHASVAVSAAFALLCCGGLELAFSSSFAKECASDTATVFVDRSVAGTASKKQREAFGTTVHNNLRKFHLLKSRVAGVYAKHSAPAGVAAALDAGSSLNYLTASAVFGWVRCDLAH